MVGAHVPPLRDTCSRHAAIPAPPGASRWGGRRAGAALLQTPAAGFSAGSRFCRIRIFILPGHANAETGFLPQIDEIWMQTLKSTKSTGSMRNGLKKWYEKTRANPAMISDYSGTRAYSEMQKMQKVLHRVDPHDVFRKFQKPLWNLNHPKKMMKSTRKTMSTKTQNDVKKCQTPVRPCFWNKW